MCILLHSAFSVDEVESYVISQTQSLKVRCITQSLVSKIKYQQLSRQRLMSLWRAIVNLKTTRTLQSLMGFHVKSMLRSNILAIQSKNQPCLLHLESFWFPFKTIFTFISCICYLKNCEIHWYFVWVFAFEFILVVYEFWVQINKT